MSQRTAYGVRTGRTGQRRRKRSRKKRIKLFLRRLKMACIFGALVLLIRPLILHAVNPTEKKDEYATETGEPVYEEAYDLAAKESAEEYLFEKEWVLAHKELFPEGKAEQALTNSGLMHFLYQYGTGEYDRNVDSELSDREKSGEIPFLYQWDERWGFREYGSSVIGFTGCGPTCLSMAVVGLTGNDSITPMRVASFAMANDYYMQDVGTKWSLMDEGAEYFGLKGVRIKADEFEIYNMLNAGYPVIASVGAGHFTDAGHFILMEGIEDGKVIVHDPNSHENSEKLWSLPDFVDEINAAWVFYAN